MSRASKVRSSIQAHEESIRFANHELVGALRDLLGPTLVAYLGSVKETRAVRQWADNERKPPMDVMSRLRTAYYVAALLRECNDTSVVQAWFQNMNPHLSDISPARALREGTVQRTGPNVVAAARAFISAG